MSPRTLPHRLFTGLALAGLVAIGAGRLPAAEPISGAPSIPATAPAEPDTLQWFRDARLGIFIHWGIYSEGKNSESWAFHDGAMSHDEYFAQAKTFTAAHYHPEQWAALFKEAGARYAVLTSKHHDGFALWDTKLSKLNAVDGSPAGRDLVGPYCEALRQAGLKVGLYFSHLDWSHPDYASILPPGAKVQRRPEYSNPWGYPQGPEHPEAWERFLAFHRGQLRELGTRYHPDLFWFDGDWERSAEQWRFKELRELLKAMNPKVVLNSRMGGYGDYETPEQYIPLVAPKGLGSSASPSMILGAISRRITITSPAARSCACWPSARTWGATCCSTSDPRTTAAFSPNRWRSSRDWDDGRTNRPRRFMAPPRGFPPGISLELRLSPRTAKRCICFISTSPWDRSP
jgi:alpha-L-fucosidase